MGTRKKTPAKARAASSSRRKRDAPQDPVTQYAQNVLAGNYGAGPHVRDACKRHLNDLQRTDLVWDLEAMEYGLAFFEEVLRLSGTHEGKPFRLLPWQQFVVGSVLGWYTAEGYRRFRMAYCETAKGSGKTPIAAGLGLFGLVADGEPRAEVYSAATKKDQAKVLFRDAVSMVEQSPELSDNVILSGGAEKNNIAYLSTASFFKPISTEDRGRGQSGPRPHFALIDELHEHATNAMVEFQRSGTKNRRNALVFIITNSGTDRQSVCFDYHDYGSKVCSGALEDDAFFAYICALDDGEDPFKDEGCWIKANPSLPEIPGMQYLREQVQQARGMKSKQNLVKRLNFCMWTESEAAWISRGDWEAVETTLDLESYKGRKAWGGIDLSKKTDLTAFATAFKNDDDTIDAFVDLFSPADTLNDREERDRVPYRTWSEEGHLITPPGKSIDYNYIASHIGKRTGEYDYQGANFDRWRMDIMESALADEDVTLELWEFGQGFKDMAPAIDAIEERISNGTIRVHINPVLRWNVASAVVVEDPAGNRKFAKNKATGRIDGLVALTMAVSAAENHEDQTSPWEDPEYTMGGNA